MRTRYKLTIAAVAAMSACAFTGYFALSKAKPNRRSPVQTRSMADGVSMRVEGSYIYRSGEDSRLLRVWSRWLDGDLSQNYFVKASIRASATGPEIDPDRTWYVPLGSNFQKGRGTQFLWEFGTVPESVERLWLRVYYRPKARPHEKPQYVDLDFPYQPAEDATPPA